MNLDPALQDALRKRPTGRPAMLQRWRDLTFLHYSVAPEVIQEKLPKGLTVDTFDGRAWVGLVPFWMTGIRFPWLPPVPGTSTFCETNVRTYVHREGEKPGVWFFSLEAANSLAVWWARRFFGLPYHRADMKIVTRGDEREYRSVRWRDDAKGMPIDHLIRARAEEIKPEPQPGSLEFFLIERYLLYAERAGRLYTGLVHHEPYKLQGAELLSCAEEMMAANGLPSLPWEHVCFSSGVDVEVFGVEPA